jgi:quinol monooxygenase YgiN
MPTHVVHLTLSIAPERQAAFERLMETEAPLTRGYEGCELFEIYAGERPGEVIFLEHWRSEAASQAYTQWRVERGDMARLGAFFTAPPRSLGLRRVTSG